jgi:hypothetical protein
MRTNTNRWDVVVLAGHGSPLATHPVDFILATECFYFLGEPVACNLVIVIAGKSTQSAVFETVQSTLELGNSRCSNPRNLQQRSRDQTRAHHLVLYEHDNRTQVTVRPEVAVLRNSIPVRLPYRQASVYFPKVGPKAGNLRKLYRHAMFISTYSTWIPGAL